MSLSSEENGDEYIIPCFDQFSDHSDDDYYDEDESFDEYSEKENSEGYPEEYTPHHFPFYKEILLRPRRLLKGQDPDFWRWPKKHRKNALQLDCRDLKMALRAIRHVQNRSDIDFLIIRVEDLFVLPFCQALRKLLAKQDRDWSIQLKCCFFTSPRRRFEEWPNMRRMLINGLSVLQHARFLGLTHDRDEGSSDKGLLLILKHLPAFRSLHMLHIEYHYWENNLDPILALPFVHQMSGLAIGSISLSYATRDESRKALQQLREISVSIGCYEEGEGGASDIIDVASKELPSLQRLDVTFPIGNDSERAVKKLVDWLVSPTCEVSELRVYVYNPKSFSVLWHIVPRMRKLRSLMLDFGDKLDIRPMLDALKASSTLDFLLLNSIVLPKGADKQLLEYQLACRPRMLEISVVTRPSEDHTYYDQIHQNSMEYQRVKRSQRSEG